MEDIVYMDNAATTRVAPEVEQEMERYFRDNFGNPSSLYTAANRAKKEGLDSSRETISGLIGVEPKEIIFTSGATESDNLAVLGAAFQRQNRRKHVVVGATEHHAVLEPTEYLQHRHGFDWDIAPVDSDGFVSPKRLANVVNENTSLVSIMHANNEVGTIQDLSPLIEVAHNSGALFHTDAVQSCGKIALDMHKLGLDMASMTGHKIYGAKGTGALYIREGIKITPLFHGGSQEKKRRPGTDNVAGAVGLAKALEIAGRRMEQDWNQISELADYFIDSVLKNIPDTYFNGPRMGGRIPQVCNISFAGIEGESILLALDMEGIACSSGSACTSGATEPSHVLVAMGKERVAAQGAIRFSLGRSTTKAQMDYVLEKLPPIIERLRSMSPMYKQETK